MLEHEDVAEELLGEELTVGKRTLAEVGGLFHIYLAAFQQESLGILDAKLWEPIKSDLQDFLTYTRAQEFWSTRDKTRYDPKFADLVDSLLPPSSPAPADGIAPPAVD